MQPQLQIDRKNLQAINLRCHALDTHILLQMMLIPNPLDMRCSCHGKYHSPLWADCSHCKRNRQKSAGLKPCQNVCGFGQSQHDTLKTPSRLSQPTRYL